MFLDVSDRNTTIYSVLPWLVALGITSVLLLMLKDDLKTYDQVWQKQMQWSVQSQYQYLDVINREEKQRALFLAQLIAHDPLVLQAVNNAHQSFINSEQSSQASSVRVQRKKLREVLERYWESASTQGVSQLSLYFAPDAITFLRMHRPNSFGDSLTGLRPEIARVMSHNEILTQFSLVSEGSGYRALVPLLFSADSEQSVRAVLELFIPSFSSAHSQLKSPIQFATFIHDHAFEASLSREARKQLNDISLIRRDDWHLEKTTDTLLYSWWNQGIVPVGIAPVGKVPLGEVPLGAVPLSVKSGNTASAKEGFKKTSKQQFILNPDQLIHSLDKTYITSWLPQQEHGDIGVAVLAWSDISNDYTHYLSMRKWIYIKWLLSLVATLVFLYVLVRFYQYKGKVLIEQQGKELQHQREISERALQRLRLALRSGESGFWEWDILHQTANFSPEWRLLCGMTAESQGAADLDEWLNRMHPADKRMSYGDLVRHIKGELPLYENEYRLRTNEGSYKWIFARGRVVEWAADGKATLMMGTYIDITERKHAELNSVRHQAALRSLNEIALLPKGNPTQQMRLALEIAAEYLALTEGMVNEVDGDKYKVSVHYLESGLNEEQKVAPLATSYCGLTVARRDLIAEDSIPNSEYRHHLAYSQTQVESYIGTPIWVDGKLYGTLSFSAQKSRHYPYDSVDKDFVKMVAYWLGLTLQHQHYLMDKTQILQRFEKLTARLPGFLYQYQETPDGRSFFPYVSSGVKKIFNVSAETLALSAAQFFKAIHPEDQGWVRDNVSYSAKHLTPWVATLRVNHPRDGIAWVHIESIPEKLDDGSVLWQGYLSDISAFKKLEAQLQNVNLTRK